MKKISKHEFEILFDSLIHFETEGGYPIAVSEKEGLVHKKHLKSYLNFSTSTHKDRPVLLTKKNKPKLPQELEILFYKRLYLDYRDLFTELEDKVSAFAKSTGI